MNQHAIFFGMRNPVGFMCPQTGAEEAALLSAAIAEGTGTAGAAASLGAGAEFGAGMGALSLGSLGLNPASLAMQAGGALLKHSAASEAAARRQKLIDAMGDYQAGNARKSTDLTGKFIEGSTPEAREAALNTAEAENKLGYEKTVGAAQAFERPGAVGGNLSDRFRADSATSATAAAERTRSLIESLSRMRAPGVAGQTEARRYGRAAGEVGALNVANGRVGNAYDVDRANVQENPWANLGGDALAGVGSGIALRDNLRRLRESAL